MVPDIGTFRHFLCLMFENSAARPIGRTLKATSLREIRSCDHPRRIVKVSLMFARSLSPRVASRSIRAIDRGLRSLERRLEGAPRRVSAGAAQGADQVSEAIASTLDRVADRFRDGAFGDEAAKIGAEAAKLGDAALRRLSREIKSRPLVILAVAIGVGTLVGALSRRRS
jgi:ElaB/YqjD/DUF883 family membrane-anchored ribosome-binding protein